MYVCSPSPPIKNQMPSIHPPVSSQKSECSSPGPFPPPRAMSRSRTVFGGRERGGGIKKTIVFCAAAMLTQSKKAEKKNRPSRGGGGVPRFVATRARVGRREKCVRVGEMENNSFRRGGHGPVGSKCAGNQLIEFSSREVIGSIGARRGECRRGQLWYVVHHSSEVIT